MNEPTTVTYSVVEVLKRIEDKIDSNQKETNERFNEVGQKLDTLQKDVTDLKVGQATLTEKVNGMNKRLETVEGTQKNQVRALIALLAGATATAGASTAARKSKGKRQKAKGWISKGLRFLLLAGYFRQAALGYFPIPLGRFVEIRWLLILREETK